MRELVEQAAEHDNISTIYEVAQLVLIVCFQSLVLDMAGFWVHWHLYLLEAI